MQLSDILDVDCELAREVLKLDNIIAINIKVTEPEKFEELVEYDAGFDTNLNLLVSTAEAKSERYTDGHSDDSFGFQQFENLENLVETEFRYICEEENDLIYLSAVIMHRIASGHPFEEGNKRTSYLAASYFLIDYIVSRTGLNQAAFPELDSDLLDTLEDIAMDEEKVSPRELANVYRESVEKELENIVRDESS